MIKSTILRGIGLLCLGHGLYMLVMMVGILVKYDHPDHWDYNLGITNIQIAYGDSVTKFEYFGTVALVVVMLFVSLYLFFMLVFRTQRLIDAASVSLMKVFKPKS